MEAVGLSLSWSPWSTSIVLPPPFLLVSLSLCAWSLLLSVHPFSFADLPDPAVSGLPLDDPAVERYRAAAWLASVAGVVWIPRSLVISSSRLS